MAEIVVDTSCQKYEDFEKLAAIKRRQDECRTI